MARCSLRWRRGRDDWVEEIMVVFGNVSGSLTSPRDSPLSSLAVRIALQTNHDHVLRF